MATHTITTTQNYSDLVGVSDYDRITISEGGKLIIDTDTAILGRATCTTIGELYIENTSTSTPIFVKTGENSATATAQLRFEGKGIMTVRGQYIDIGSTTGVSGQQLTLPTTGSQLIPYCPSVMVFEPTKTEPTIYNCVDSFTDCFGDDKLGTVFIHDPVTNQITFGDGYNGHIPTVGSIVKIPNIIFVDETTGTGYTDFDLATSGKLDINGAMFCDNFAYNFYSASSVQIENVCFGLPREDFDLSALQAPSVKNCGILLQNNAHLFNLSGTNNFSIENVFIYNTEETAQYHGFYPTNGAVGSFESCRVVAPNIPYSSSRTPFYCTSPYLTFNKCFSASSGVGFLFTSGTGNNTVTDCGINCAGKRNPTEFGPYMISSANCSNIVIERLVSHPLLEADGATPANIYAISTSTGTASFTINDCDIYAGDVGTSSRSNHLIYSNGIDHRYNDIRVHGSQSGDTINFSTSASNNEARNIVFLDPDTHNNDIEWTDGCFYDLVATADSLDTAPSASGVGVSSLHLRVGNSTTAGRLYKPMGDDGGQGLLTEINLVGDYYFNNGGALYMNTAEDIIELETAIHGGITGFTGYSKYGGTASDFDVTVAMRNPNGVYTSFEPFSTTGLQDAFGNLTNYDFNVGLQIKYRIRKTVSNMTSFLYHLRADTIIEENYVSPFEVYPSYLTISGLDSGDAVYIENASHEQKAYSVSDGSDFSISLPNDNNGEVWTYIVKRAGYSKMKGVVTLENSLKTNVVFDPLQKKRAGGSNMYTGQTSSYINTVFSSTITNIDVGDASVSPQVIFDEFEQASTTNEGMRWLALSGSETSFDSLPGVGDILFLEDDIRIRRENAGDANSAVAGYIVSTQGTPINAENGSVAFVAQGDQGESMTQELFDSLMLALPSTTKDLMKADVQEIRLTSRRASTQR